MLLYLTTTSLLLSGPVTGTKNLLVLMGRHSHKLYLLTIYLSLIYEKPKALNV